MENKNEPSLEQTIKLIRELADESPSTLTRILRESGCWVYLLHPLDITEYNEDVSYGEAQSALRTLDADDIMPYGELCSAVVRKVEKNRLQNKKTKRKN